MGSEVIVTAILGIITSFVSAWVSWFFTRKKYSAEVDELRGVSSAHIIRRLVAKGLVKGVSKIIDDMTNPKDDRRR